MSDLHALQGTRAPIRDILCARSSGHKATIRDILYILSKLASHTLQSTRAPIRDMRVKFMPGPAGLTRADQGQLPDGHRLAAAVFGAAAFGAAPGATFGRGRKS